MCYLPVKFLNVYSSRRATKQAGVPLLQARGAEDGGGSPEQGPG